MGEGIKSILAAVLLSFLRVQLISLSFSGKYFSMKCIKNIQTSAGENGPQTQHPVAPGIWPHLLSERISEIMK